MLDDFQEEINDPRLPARNLRYALIALGLSIVTSLMAFFAMDTIARRNVNAHAIAMVEIFLNYILTIASGVFAFIACRNSLRSLKTDKNVRNYIALVIGGLLLFGICRLILGRLLIV